MPTHFAVTQSVLQPRGPNDRLDTPRRSQATLVAIAVMQGHQAEDSYTPPRPTTRDVGTQTDPTPPPSLGEHLRGYVTRLFAR